MLHANTSISLMTCSIRWRIGHGVCLAIIIYSTNLNFVFHHTSDYIARQTTMYFINNSLSFILQLNCYTTRTVQTLLVGITLYSEKFKMHSTLCTYKQYFGLVITRGSWSPNDIQLFREKLSEESKKMHARIAKDSLGYNKYSFY